MPTIAYHGLGAGNCIATSTDKNLDVWTKSPHNPVIPYPEVALDHDGAEFREILDKFPDYGVIFAWNFASEIVRNNQKFLDRGGKFINPIPYPRIMEFPQKEDLFGAKVTKITPDFEDSRGKITDLVNASINHVGLITTEAGAQRGPHYHKQSTQNSYILSGSFEVSLAHKDDLKNMKRIVLKAGEMISIPSFVIHGFKAREKATMIDISQTRGDTGYEADVVRINLEDLGE